MTKFLPLGQKKSENWALCFAKDFDDDDSMTRLCVWSKSIIITQSWWSDLALEQEFALGYTTNWSFFHRSTDDDFQPNLVQKERP